MIPPKNFIFSFFSNLPPNDSRELPKKGNIIPNIDGIKNTLEVVSLLTLVKTLFSIRTIRITRKAIIVWSIFLIASYMVALINIYSPPRKENDYIPVAKYIKTHSMNTLHVITCRNKLALPLSYYLNHQKVIPIPRSIDYMKGYNHEDWAVKFTDDLKDALIILKLGNYSWLLTDKMEYIFGIDYHPELIDEYIHDNFLVIEEHTFHKNLTLRLIKKINKQPREINKASQKNIYPWYAETSALIKILLSLLPIYKRIHVISRIIKN